MKKAISLILAFTFILSFCACGKDDAPQQTEEPVFRVVTTFYPIYVTALNIIDGAANVTLENLTDPNGGCIHNYTVSTEDLKSLSGADLLIACGLNMEAFVGKVSLGVPGLVVLDGGEDIQNVLTDSEDGNTNPHYWMNIDNTVSLCEKIKLHLIQYDPANAAVYEKNAADYEAKLTALKTEAEERTKALKTRDMVVFHESFDYFANEFGLNIVSVISNHDGSAPPAKELAETIDYMKLHNITSVFTEAESESSVADTVANETGAEVYVLDCLTSGEANESAKDAYINAIKADLDVLEKALNK